MSGEVKPVEFNIQGTEDEVNRLRREADELRFWSLGCAFVSSLGAGGSVVLYGVISELQSYGWRDSARLWVVLGALVAAAGFSGYAAFDLRTEARELAHRANILEGGLMTTKQ